MWIVYLEVVAEGVPKRALAGVQVAHGRDVGGLEDHHTLTAGTKRRPRNGGGHCVGRECGISATGPVNRTESPGLLGEPDLAMLLQYICIAADMTTSSGVNVALICTGGT